MRLLPFNLGFTLYLAVQAQMHRPRADTGSSQEERRNEVRDWMHEGAALVEICTGVVAKGFRSLTQQLHDGAKEVQMSDMATLVNLLQCILSGPAYEHAHGQIASALGNSGINRVAISLLSWCETLGPRRDDSTVSIGYASLCLGLLQALSTVPILAQFLAAESVLSQNEGASVMRFLRRAGSGEMAEQGDAAGRTMLRVWSRNVLPLVLNLGVAVGDSFAPEAASFLNGFSEQLQRASDNLEGKGHGVASDGVSGGITYEAAYEAHTLSLLHVLLEGARSRPGAGAGMEVEELKWDSAGVKEDADSWVNGSLAALRERIIVTDERESRLFKQGKLEEMILAELRGVLTCLNGSNGDYTASKV